MRFLNGKKVLGIGGGFLLIATAAVLFWLVDSSRGQDKRPEALLPGGIGWLDFYDVGLVAIDIAVVLAIVSAVTYTIRFWRQI